MISAMRKTLLLTSVLLLFLSVPGIAQNHPNLILTQAGVKNIQASNGKAPLFESSLQSVKSEIDIIINQPQDVPVPKDGGGGYTHERHKQNYQEMNNAGILYQLTGNKQYAEFVKNMLLKYADLYPTLPLHPVQKSKYRGRIFWQGLNECVWLVNTSQAYDCIYDYLNTKDRNYIEKNLFYPMVKFISEDNKETFDKIHNHGTWAVAAVGMIGYVMNNKELVEKSLYGTTKDGKSGFLKQMDLLFSPDGYFTEGPYYQRYSLQPFVMFGQVIQNNEPERKIFEYRDSILVKAVNTSLQLTYTDGQFFHLNDALDKTWHSIELIYGVDIVYNVTKDTNLLSVAKEQNKVIISDAGLNTAIALANKSPQPFAWKTLLIKDGAAGDEGGIGILRMGDPDDQTCVVLKATAQGMGHGHFDKLSVTYYDNGKEILPDYGAARFLNIEPKNGGHYLPENDTWAKQTIAHNTVTIDEASNFEGILKTAELYSPKITAFIDKDDFKMVSAIDTNAYPGVTMQRSIIMIKPSKTEKPLVLDVFEIVSPKKDRQYDLSYYYHGQLIYTDLEYTPYTNTRTPLGKANGYEYLWKEAEGTPAKDQKNIHLTFLNGNRFYTITTSASDKSFYFNRIGANDPNFNLRNEPSFMLRAHGENTTFVSVIEPHGEFNARAEYTIQPYSNIQSVQIIPNSTGSGTNKIAEIKTSDNKIITVNLTEGNYSVNVK